MTLITGTPIGTITSQSDVRIEGAPNIWYQDYLAQELYRPDADQFYWGLSATATYPVIELGCLEGVTMADNLTMNDVTCDASGVTDTMQRRNYVELNLTLKTLLPLATIRHILKGGPVTTSGTIEKMGIGVIDNAQFFHAYWAKVYDESLGKFVNCTLHKCKFVDAWTIDFRYGNAWQITGVKLRAFALTSLPSAQQFATIIHVGA